MKIVAPHLEGKAIEWHQGLMKIKVVQLETVVGRNGFDEACQAVGLAGHKAYTIIVLRVGLTYINGKTHDTILYL